MSSGDGGNADIDINNGKEIAARLFFKPFVKTEIAALKNLGVGVAGSYGKAEGSLTTTGLPTYKTPGQQTFFRYLSDGTAPNTTIARGTTWRVVPQLSYYFGPFSLTGQYAISSYRVAKDTLAADLRNKAWEVTAAYILTGDKATPTRLKPKKPFSWSKKQFGAVEVFGHYAEERIDRGAFPNFASLTRSASLARVYGGGVVWHLNDNVKLNTSFLHTQFTRGVTGTGNRAAENVLTSRLQVAF